MPNTLQVIRRKSPDVGAQGTIGPNVTVLGSDGTSMWLRSPSCGDVPVPLGEFTAQYEAYPFQGA